MFHLQAWGQSLDPGGVYTQVNAVQDQVVTTNGVFAYVPDAVKNIVAAAALVDSTVAPLAKFSSPSLRALTDLQVRPVNDGLVFASQANIMVGFQNPIPLVANEGIEFDVNDNPAAGVEHYGLLWLADGPLKPTNGPVFTTRATAAAALAANAWVNSNLTFDEALPAGSYQVVGMRAEGTHLVAARLVFVGGSFRPGVPGLTSETASDRGLFRGGYAGVFGQFDSTTPPTVDCLGVTDNSQQIYLDLIKVK